MENRLDEERKKNPLPIEPLTEVLFGGAQKLAIFRKAVAYLEKDDFLVEKDFSYYDLSRVQLRERTLEKINRIAALKRSLEDKELFEAILAVVNQVDDSFSMRLLVDFGLFVSAIEGAGTTEQIRDYADKVKNFELFGCFGMTELGNGSYLQSLETTATYDKETQEFILLSPTLTSIKWWIGGASQSATHAVIFAKLITEEGDKGTHSFIVPLRDNQFNVLPGIKIGDVGPKRGRNGLDNGWIEFDHFRIPRTHMLMKWSQVTKDGKYIPAELPQLAYGALVGGRVSIIISSIRTVKISLTIAIRYSTIRDQQTIKGDCLLDYRIQQERLIGGLCGVYAYHFAASELSKYHEEVQKELGQKDISHLKELHYRAAGLKAFCLPWCYDTINQTIISMGGHGYSRFAGVSDQLNDIAVLLPGEGDVIVMAQQVASYLIKTMKKIKEGSLDIPESLQYLAGSAKPNSNFELDSSYMLKASQFLAKKLIKSVYDRLEEDQAVEDELTAWNNCQVELVQAAKAHVYYGIIKDFYQILENELSSALGDAKDELLPHLNKLADLFALRHLNEFLFSFYENNYFTVETGEHIRANIRKLYIELRPFANPLVDALGIPDMLLRSPLGRYDGNLYAHYYEAVTNTKTTLKPRDWQKHLSKKIVLP
jgi:acyl-CoA oxidase